MMLSVDRFSLVGYLLFLGLAVAVEGWIQLDPARNFQFIDSSDQSVRIYHGLNVVFKEPPFLPCYDCPFDPQLSLNAQDIANLQGWGFNMVRLGIMWTAVEPEKGEYNYTFLSDARALVDALGEAGIVTLVDMHQDLFSPATCGEGFPQWVAQEAIQWRACNESFAAKAAHLIGACKSITDFGMRFDSDGNPLPEDCVQHPFSFFYPTPEAATSFQSLYDNYADIQDGFRAFWNVTSAAFADSEYVIGYDLINEPFVGDLWRDLMEVIKPGRTDNMYLQPMYSSLNSVIRQNDAEHLIFYEPTPLPDALPFFGGLVWPVGFNSTPGAEMSPGKDVLSYHIYCCLSAPNACDKDGNPTDAAVCDKFNPHNVAMRTADQKRLSSGGFLTEFGACTTGASCVGEIERTTSAADSAFQSWAYWQYKYYDDVTTTSGPMEGLYDPSTGAPYADKLAALTRTYAQVIQGNPQHMSFNMTSAEFTLSYTTMQGPSESTAIYYSPLYYPSGPQVQLDPSNLVSFQFLNSHVILQHSSSLPVGTLVSVTITP